ncbi:MAG: penicillin-binding transpeptidase domain-containing protein [Ruminococcus sp.]
MQQLKNRLAFLRLLLVLLFCTAAVYLAWLVQKPELIQTAARQGTYTCTAGTARGTIYDRNGVPLVNTKTACIAVVSPTPAAAEALLSHVTDTAAFYEKLAQGMPFTCTVDTADIDCPDVTILQIPQRSTSPQLAQHVIGYTREGSGVAGLESAYDAILHSVDSQWSVTFSVDGTGTPLAGEPKQIRYGANPTAGIMTTLDSRIQRICESAGSGLEKGCIVVGRRRYLGAASPGYSADSRAMHQRPTAYDGVPCSVSVGSIFKLVTAACAFDQGVGYNFTWDCDGAISVGTQRFRCHELQGHGVQHMADAMRSSCNPYFIALGQALSGSDLLQTAKSLGFGTEIMLTSNMIASGGTLPTLQQLKLPAEQANFSFGQGVLTASPLQIARMTCAIARDGTLPAVRLVRGVTDDGRTVLREERGIPESGIAPETAAFLRRLMCYTAADEDFQGRPAHVSMGAKTSTAQTGRCDVDGTEYCHGWVTAFFPAEQPKYAVTVLAEDGGYGNQAASPILRQITGAIMQVE